VSTPEFFEQIHGCKHEHLDPDYCEYVFCSTPYCGGYEHYCLDCHSYITTCGCGCENWISDKPSASKDG